MINLRGEMLMEYKPRYLVMVTASANNNKYYKLKLPTPFGVMNLEKSIL